MCDECHDKIDTGEIIINGWKETTNGKVLDYELKEKTTIIKHSDELINYIKELKKLNDPKMALIKIKEKFNKKVSIKTVEKYWN